jgi:hypothetical protein
MSASRASAGTRAATRSRRLDNVCSFNVAAPVLATARHDLPKRGVSLSGGGEDFNCVDAWPAD